MAPKTAGPPIPLSSLLFALSLFAMLAVALVWLGIGSIQARCRARALPIFSWSWLVMGRLCLVMMAFLVPRCKRRACLRGAA
jgi:hypothetical protein